VVIALQFNPDVLLAIATLVTACGGILATLASLRMKAIEQKRRDDDECFQKLMGARKEAEEAASELHEIKMRKAREE